MKRDSIQSFAKAAPTVCAPACRACELRTMHAFKPVELRQLDAINAFRKTTRQVAAGKQIMAEHGVSNELFTLYSGWAFRYKTLSDGRRQILQFLLPGDFIGLQDEFADGQTCGAEAATDCMLCVFPRDGLWKFFHGNPELGYDVTWLAARDEKIVDDNLLTNGRRNAMERVAMLLMHLYRRAERVGLMRDGASEFPFNQQHIADALGLSLVHTNKTLRRLRKMGLHELDAGLLKILDASALENVADYFERPQKVTPLL